MVATVRSQLDALGAKDTKIVVTNDLNEHTIAGLRGSPVDVFGVGTSVVTGSGHPAVGLVYKLVARTSDAGEWISVAKKSSQKGNPGGKKRAYRLIANGIAREEVVTIGSGHDQPEGARALEVSLLESGERTDSLSPAALVDAARQRHESSIAELPDAAFSLSPGDPALPTRFIKQGRA